jgi:hypothetical protein
MSQIEITVRHGDITKNFTLELPDEQLAPLAAYGQPDRQAMNAIGARLAHRLWQSMTEDRRKPLQANDGGTARFGTPGVRQGPPAA